MIRFSRYLVFPSYRYQRLTTIVQSNLHSRKTIARFEAKEIRLQWLTKASLLANLTISGVITESGTLLYFLGFPSQ
jgi:hypothetical protein